MRMGEHFPLLHLLSETLHAATPSVKSISASSATLSPALDFGASTEKLPSELTFVYINRLTGVMMGRFSPKALLMLSRQLGCP